MKTHYPIFRHDENPILGHYQLAYITLDLFGDWNIVKSYGKIGQKKHKLTSTPYRSKEEALRNLQKKSIFA